MTFDLSFVQFGVVVSNILVKISPNIDKNTTIKSFKINIKVLMNNFFFLLRMLLISIIIYNKKLILIICTWLIKYDLTNVLTYFNYKSREIKWIMQVSPRVWAEGKRGSSTVAVVVSKSSGQWEVSKGKKSKCGIDLMQLLGVEIVDE